MSSNSMWLAGSAPHFPELSGNQYADTVIVGGGLTGLTAAYYLAKAGQNVAVVEAGVVGCCASGHTTAHITSQHDDIYFKFIRRFGPEAAMLFAKANEESIAAIGAIIEEEHIPCGFELQNSYLVTNDDNNILTIEREAKAAKSLGLPAELARPDFFLPYKAALRFSGQAAFHPIQYATGLADAITRLGGRIYENSRILHLRSNTAITKTGGLHGKNVILATHFPMINFPGWYSARALQSRSYVMAFAGTPAVSGLYNFIDINGYTYRMSGENLIVCGEGHKCGTDTYTNHYGRLQKTVLASLPNAEVVTQWSAQDAITADDFPYIGLYSKKTPNLYVATGYRKWGMTQSNLAARLLRDEILKQENPCAKIFSPSRPLVAYAFFKLLYLNLAVAGHYSAGLVRLKNPRCAHMKCGTVWNDDEKSWDCPCHGSRFDKDGNVLDTPSIHGLKDPVTKQTKK